MNGWLLTLSLALSTLLVGAIQHYSINLGYIVGAVLIALHFFIVALYFTKGAR